MEHIVQLEQLSKDLKGNILDEKDQIFQACERRLTKLKDLSGYKLHQCVAEIHNLQREEVEVRKKCAALTEKLNQGLQRGESKQRLAEIRRELERDEHHL